MATLYLLNDFSCALPWNLAAIHANKSNLAKKGLEFGPFPELGTAILPTHEQMWRHVPNDKPTPPGFAKHFNSIENSLDAGRDVLLFHAGISLPAYQTLSRYLATLPDDHKIKSIFVIGSPVCAYEQRWRYLAAVRQADQIPQARRFAGIFGLIENDRQAYGSDNVELIPDLSASPRAILNADIIKRIFAALERPGFDLPHGIPPHPLIFSTDTARRLHNARWTRMNVWPPMNEDKFREILLSCESGWGNEPMSPRKLRWLLHAEGEENQARLENAMNLPHGALNPPQWLLDDEQIAHGAPLDMEKVRAFTQALPMETARTLAARITADPALGFYAQRCLLKGLAARHENEFQHIGEPLPPVEMTVLTMAYNQEEFIAECMDSVLAQKTDFQVRHLVLDHCSSDATPKIIAEYARKNPSIRPVLLPTRWKGENVRGLFLRCKSKYASLCDGDDYFTDPLKLQKQVDFLEKHPRCSLAFHPVHVRFEDGRHEDFIYPPVENLPRGLKEEYYLTDLFKSNFIQTNSVVYRWRFTDGLPSWFRADINPSDWYWHLLHAEIGKIGFINTVMSVYRRHSKALFSNGFLDAKAHRRDHGMAELQTYKVVNEHFKGRYFRELASLANGVFANFLELFMEGDREIMDAACAAYPEFGANFLKNLKIEAGKKAEMDVHATQ